jgi:hypothetical protein
MMPIFLVFSSVVLRGIKLVTSLTVGAVIGALKKSKEPGEN